MAPVTAPCEGFCGTVPAANCGPVLPAAGVASTGLPSAPTALPIAAPRSPPGPAGRRRDVLRGELRGLLLRRSGRPSRARATTGPLHGAALRSGRRASALVRRGRREARSDRASARAPASARRASPRARRQRRAPRSAWRERRAASDSAAARCFMKKNAAGCHRAHGHEAAENEGDDLAVALLLLGARAPAATKTPRRVLAGNTREARASMLAGAAARTAGSTAPAAGALRRVRRVGGRRGAGAHGGGLVVEETGSRAAVDCGATGRATCGAGSDTAAKLMRPESSPFASPARCTPLGAEELGARTEAGGGVRPPIGPSSQGPGGCGDRALGLQASSSLIPLRRVFPRQYRGSVARREL